MTDKKTMPKSLIIEILEQDIELDERNLDEKLDAMQREIESIRNGSSMSGGEYLARLGAEIAAKQATIRAQKKVLKGIKQIG